jgi:hypothetical protein
LGGSRTPTTNHMRAFPEPNARVRRRGPMGWWIDLTAPPLRQGPLPVDQRERLRKAELTSYSILGVFAFLVALVSNSLASAATAQAVGTMAVFLFIGALLNRTGHVRLAAYLVPSALLLLIALSVVAAPGLRPIGLPIFDLFTIPIILVSLVGDRRASWVYALIAIAFITTDYTLQPPALVTAPGGARFDELAYEQSIYGWWGMINRHIALCFFAALFGWLGARSVDRAILRADQAEELAALEHQVAEQRRSLEAGARQLLDAHVRIANGDFGASVPPIQDPILWQVGQSFNNMVGRFIRAAQSEHQLARTEDEIRRLAAAIDDAQAGRQPIWPAPAHTAADLILQRIGRNSRLAAGPSVQAPQQPQQPQQPSIPQRMEPLQVPGWQPSGPGPGPMPGMEPWPMTQSFDAPPGSQTGQLPYPGPAQSGAFSPQEQSLPPWFPPGER